MERKGFGIRLGALVIDAVIIWVLYFILNLLIGPKLVIDLSMTPDEMLAMATSYARRYYLIIAIPGLAMAAVEILRAQTPGKMILKMIIRDQGGEAAKPPQLLKRAALKYGMYAVYLLIAITAVEGLRFVAWLIQLAFIGGSFAALGQTRQALHDMLGKTAVFGPPSPVAAAGLQPAMPGAPGAAPPPPAAAPPTAPPPQA
jgi:uncharacterized RDD family membrane protein YckC